MLKKLTSILMALLLLCALSTSSFAAAVSVVAEEQRLSNEVVANEQYQNLLANLSNVSKTRSTSLNYYGGAFINDDGNLVVCVTSDYDVRSGMIQAYTDNENIILTTVEYPYDTLLQEQTNIAEVYEALSGASFSTTTLTETADAAPDTVERIYSSFCGAYIDEERNVLVVEIEELSAEKIDAFKTVFSDAEYITFEEGYRATETATTLYPGGEIRKITSNGYSSCSIGYRAHYTSADGSLSCYGFVTAGHAFSAGDKVYAKDGTTVIGTCLVSHGGNADSAFVWITNPNYSVSNVTAIKGVSLSTSSYAVPAQGSTIRKEGKTSGYSSGTVVSTSVLVVYDTGQVVYDLIKTTALNLKGDSGGVAYTSAGLIIGTMSGSSWSGESLTSSTFEYSYIAKVGNELNVLNCELC